MEIIVNDLKIQIFDYLVKEELLNFTDYDIETVKTETEISELGLDSLDLIETIMDAEDKFGIEIPDEDFKQSKTIGDIVDVIYNRIEVMEQEIK